MTGIKVSSAPGSSEWTYLGAGAGDWGEGTAAWFGCINGSGYILDFLYTELFSSQALAFFR